MRTIIAFGVAIFGLVSACGESSLDAAFDKNRPATF
jgi:hypothetical protein